MSHAVHVKATHKAIQTYYQTLKDYREHDVGHETALRSATSSPPKWTSAAVSAPTPTAEDPEYIIRLVGQIVCISVETARIVAALLAKFSP